MSEPKEQKEQKEPWADPKSWQPNYVATAIENARYARNDVEGWTAADALRDHSGVVFMPSGGRGIRWDKFTPELRDRYAELLDEAITALRQVRAAIAARDWRTCDGCATGFVGVEGQRFHSVACKQRAYRARKRLAEPSSADGTCGCCRGTGKVPMYVVYAADPSTTRVPHLGRVTPDGLTPCPVCGLSGTVSAPEFWYALDPDG